MIELPILNSSYFSYQIILDSITYILELRFNSAKSFWALSIKDLDNNVLINNIKLIPWTNLLEQHTGIGPTGGIFLIDTKHSFAESIDKVDNTTLGDTFKLVYAEKFEMDFIKGQ